MGVVRLSYLADRDLDEIRQYIERDNPQAANDMLEKVFDTLETLANYPELGERRGDLGKNIRVFTVRPYLVFYHPAADGIHVARVVHGARDFPAMFR
jgi:plasmid stabilization system protein ParE